MAPIDTIAIVQHRQEWLAALRSGRYRQTSGQLTDEHGAYCCLGVACEIAGLERRGSTYEDETLILPLGGMEWLGVNDANPSVDWVRGGFPEDQFGESITQDDAPLPNSVAEMNDQGWSFDMIADVVEYFGFAHEQDALVNEYAAEALAVRRQRFDRD